MNEPKVKLNIDGTEIEARKGQSILEAALSAEIYIPHLCYHPDLSPFEETFPNEACYRGPDSYKSESEDKRYPGCGLCLVRVEGREEPVLSCLIPAEEGMRVDTSHPEIGMLRQQNLAIILEKHPHACLTCAQKEGCSLTQCSTNVPEEERCCPQFDFCELRKVAEFVGIKEDIRRYVPSHLYCEEDKPLFIRDYNLCIGCLRCVRVCKDVIGAKSLAYVVDEEEIVVGTLASSLEESGCLFCGACVEVCPTGALRDKDLKPGDKKAALVPCTASCPVEMDIPAYVRAVSQGECDEAARIIRNRVPLAFTLGHICPHPCEEECRRGQLNQAIAICDLKRFALDTAMPTEKISQTTPTGKRVAVVGSGPAGLVASYYLARLGHTVKIFEAREEPGGMLRWALPEFRLPRDVIRKEIEHIKAAGVEVVTGRPIAEQSFLEDLKTGMWDAVFLATGLQESITIDVEGGASEGVSWGLDFLRAAKEQEGPSCQGKVVVIGGGNVAVDVAMTAIRLEAAAVEMACLEERDEMPAFSWEIQEAEEEGIVIHTGWGPHKIESEEGRVKGVILRRCTAVFDDKGRFCPSFDDSHKKTIDADSVILAVGQKTDLSYLPQELEIEISNDQTLGVNPDTLETAVRGIFAGGEVTTGPASAVEAMAAGRKAASSIDKFLGGDGILESSSEIRTDGKRDLWMGKKEGFHALERVPVPRQPLSERAGSFELIQEGYKMEKAQLEASRCLQCDQRLKLSPVVLPPEKWLEFNPEAVSQVPESEGAFQLLDEGKNIISIIGTPNLRQALTEQLTACPDAKYFSYEEDPMYTKRESELIQQFLQTHGHLPPGNEDVDDLF